MAIIKRKREKRRAPRVPHPYFLTYRQTSPLPANPKEWESSTARNISTTGILFLSAHHFKRGASLEIRMKNPFLKAETQMEVTVIRCHSYAKTKTFYLVGVNIDKIKGSRKAFKQAVEYFYTKGSAKINKL